MEPSHSPPRTVAAALKEWAAVAAAMRAGRQSILLRAGGIADPSGRFGFPHPAFWIYPTRFHESAERLAADAKPFAESAGRSAGEPAVAGAPTIRELDLMATLATVHWIEDRTVAERLVPLHVLAAAVVRERFDYRQPGIAVAFVRVWRRREPHRIVETFEMEGCRSWVQLPEPLDGDGLEPVLDDASFESERRRFSRLIGH